MWQNVKPACWQPDSERKIHDMFVSWLYANETHLGWNLRWVEIVLSWRAKLSLFPHCFAFCIKVFSEIMGTFLHGCKLPGWGAGGVSGLEWEWVGPEIANSTILVVRLFFLSQRAPLSKDLAFGWWYPVSCSRICGAVHSLVALHFLQDRLKGKICRGHPWQYCSLLGDLQ